MYQRLGKVLAAGIVIGMLTACADGRAGDEPAVGPTLPRAATGVTADLRHTVSVLGATGAETVVSSEETTVSARFDRNGVAFAPPGIGASGPLAWRADDAFAAPRTTRRARFVDGAGVQHELLVTADAPGPWTRIEYRRGGRTVFEQRATWNAADEGWVLAVGTSTYHLGRGVDIRIELQGRNVRVAGVAPDLAPLASLGRLVGAWLAPRPLAAQFYFGECTDDWLKWAGTVLLAELAWAKFVESRSPMDFKKAAAATTAAGVALSGLVDCMVEQDLGNDSGL